MNAYSSIAILILLAGTLLVLPLLPALVELRRKSDVLPLNVIQQHAGEIRYFADSFRAYIKGLRPALRQCLATGTTATGTMPDSAEYLVLGRGEEALVLPLHRADGGCPMVIASSTDLLLPSHTSFSRDIYADGRLIGGAHNNYRAVLAEKDVHLGSGSRVMRWVHAGSEFAADPGCQLFGRVSSDCSIRLRANCSFVRLNAPRIEIGSAPDGVTASPISKKLENLASRRVLHDGDFVIPAGKVFYGDLVVRGKLRIGTAARVYGSVKCEKDTLLETGVQIAGSLVAERKMHIGANCMLHGPVIAERSLFMASGTRCGTAEAPTTVSAPRIVAEEDVVVFGTLWAREQGRVVAKR